MFSPKKKNSLVFFKSWLCICIICLTHVRKAHKTVCKKKKKYSPLKTKPELPTEQKAEQNKANKALKRKPKPEVLKSKVQKLEIHKINEQKPGSDLSA